MLMELNTTHIALIPKNKCPKDVTEYRPIACCNILYKCITKMICNRLKMVLPDLISENQGAFVHQRYILHNINRHKKSKRKHEGDDDVNDIHQHKKSKAETEAERMEWVNKITGFIRSLLNSHLLEQMSTFPADEKNTSSSVTETMSNVPVSHSRNPSNDIDKLAVGVSQILREILGNDHCAECGAPDLDWASLNLGILICIECSGAHRNLGVHISKVSKFEDIPSAQAILVGTLAPGVNIVCNGEAKCSIKGPFLIIDEKTIVEDDMAKPKGCGKSVSNILHSKLSRSILEGLNHKMKKK